MKTEPHKLHTSPPTTMWYTSGLTTKGDCTSHSTGLRSSRLDIVDLAGASPGQADGHSEGTLAEGSDLYALRRVVNQLAARTPKRRVDYAASPLTHLLRDALGGNSVTLVVATVTDSEAHMAATAHTLEFAHLVRSVYNRPSITELPPSAELLALFSAELAQLKEQLVHGVTVEPVRLYTRDPNLLPVLSAFPVRCFPHNSTVRMLRCTTPARCTVSACTHPEGSHSRVRPCLALRIRRSKRRTSC